MVWPKNKHKILKFGNSPVVQCLRLHTPNSGGIGRSLVRELGMPHSLAKIRKKKRWQSSPFLQKQNYPFSSVHLLSHVRLFATPWTAACQVSLSFIISWSQLKLISIESVMSFNHLILGRPLLLPPSIFPCIRVFSNESALSISWPSYWSFSISLSNEYSGLISFRLTGLISLLSKGLSRAFSYFITIFF